MKFRCYVDDMYLNRFHRTTPKRNQTITPNTHPQFFINCSEIAFDERVRYIEQVCQILIESRFGPGCVAPVVIALSDRPDLEPIVFYDLCEGEPDGRVPNFSVSPLGRKGYQVIEAALRRAKQMELVDAAPNAQNSTNTLSPNQGRGSP